MADHSLMGSRDPGLYVWLRGEVFVALPRPATHAIKNPKGFEGSIKSPEPTAVGAVSSAVAVHVASRRWLSFFR